MVRLLRQIFVHFTNLLTVLRRMFPGLWFFPSFQVYLLVQEAVPRNLLSFGCEMFLDVAQSPFVPGKRTCFLLLQSHSTSAAVVSLDLWLLPWILLGRRNKKLFLVISCILKSCNFKRKSVKDWPQKWLFRTTSVLMASFAKSSFCLWTQQVNNWKNAHWGRQPTILQHISCALYAVPTSLPNIPCVKVN